jgi:hypothetical protein
MLSSTSSPSSLIFLPRDILCFVANYFLGKDDQNKKIFQFPIDWRNFLNASKEHFGQWKKETQIFVLSVPFVETFYNSPDFREVIFKLVETPQLQVELIFDYEQFRGDTEEFKIVLKKLPSVRKIYVDGQKVVPSVIDVQELCLHNCSVKDLSFFSQVKNVSFSSDSRKTIFDFSSLQKIEKGSFEVSRCVNYQMLANLKSLELYNCDSVKDVSCFQNIPHLVLSRCSGIIDVSSLGKCQNLNLSYCRNIRDGFSALGKVPTLDLSHCDQLTDLSALTGVLSLRFQGFKGTNFIGLEKVGFLDISESNNVSDLSVLQSVKQLNIQDCKKIFRLRELGKLKELQTTWKGETDTSSEVVMEVFPRLRKVRLFNECSTDSLWTDQQFLSSLKNIKEISLFNWNIPNQFPVFDNLQSLEIFGCNNIPEFSVPVLSCLSRLEISYAENLTFLHLLGNSELKYPLYELIIHECCDLKKLQVDCRVFHCSVDICYDLKVIEVHRQIAHLKCDSLYLKKIINQSKIVSLDLSSNNAKFLVDKEKDEMTFEQKEDFFDEENEEEEEEEW